MVNIDVPAGVGAPSLDKWSVEETTFLHTEEVNFVVISSLHMFYIIIEISLRLKTS